VIRARLIHTRESHTSQPKARRTLINTQDRERTAGVTFLPLADLLLCFINAFNMSGDVHAVTAEKQTKHAMRTVSCVPSILSASFVSASGFSLGFFCMGMAAAFAVRVLTWHGSKVTTHHTRNTVATHSSASQQARTPPLSNNLHDTYVKVYSTRLQWTLTSP
jgi:hypothetical protein